MHERWLRRLFATGLILALGGAWLTWRAIARGPLPAGEIRQVTEFSNEPALPAFRLLGPRGEFSNADLAGQWNFIFFGYTRCPDVCPTTLGMMKDIKAQSAAVSPAPTFRVLFVSVDPQRDTPDLLAAYLAAFDPDFLGMSGTDTALQPLVKSLGVFYQRHDSIEKANYTVDHGTGLYLIDPAGRLAATFSPPHDAKQITADFHRIAAR